jgi:hypothetical protein
MTRRSTHQHDRELGRKAQSEAKRKARMERRRAKAERRAAEATRAAWSHPRQEALR